MKLFMVHHWEPYETPSNLRYFISREKAYEYFNSVFEKGHYRNKWWEIEEIETED